MPRSFVLASPPGSASSGRLHRPGPRRLHRPGLLRRARRCKSQHAPAKTLLLVLPSCSFFAASSSIPSLLTASVGWVTAAQAQLPSPARPSSARPCRPNVSNPRPDPDSAQCTFFSCLRICLLSRERRFYRKVPSLHAYNNSLTVHRIKKHHICKMLRISSSFIICCLHPCLKCLKCCLHLIC